MLSLLPAPLLALVASHLDPAPLLRLQRCSSTLHSLSTDEAYLAVAWRHTVLHLNTSARLAEWMFPIEQCVVTRQHDVPFQRSIPLAVWQAALPALQAARTRLKRFDRTERSQALQQYRQWLCEPQPSMWISARRDRGGRLWQVDEAEEQQAAGVERMEVLRHIHWTDVSKLLLQGRDVEVRCRLVLEACPYLQSLSLQINVNTCIEPAHKDTFALLPRLRSLSLVQTDDGSRALYYPCEEPPVDLARMLHTLPRLTCLHCTDIHMGLDDLLNIALHSTLEQLHIQTQYHQEGIGVQWLAGEIKFPISSVEEDEQWLQLDASRATFDGDIAAESEVEVATAPVDRPVVMSVTTAGREDALSAAERAAIRTKLTRTRPTRRSCEIRLALAEWLHRRLRRARLHTDDQYCLMWMLRHYRNQLSVLRRTLQMQLSEIAAAPHAAR